MNKSHMQKSVKREGCQKPQIPELLSFERRADVLKVRKSQKEIVVSKMNKKFCPSLKKRGGIKKIRHFCILIRNY